jgi:hypothetical protein
MKQDTKTYEQGLRGKISNSTSSHTKLQEDIDAKMQEALRMEHRLQAEKAKNDIRKFLIKEVHNAVN